MQKSVWSCRAREEGPDMAQNGGTAKIILDGKEYELPHRPGY